MNQNRGLVAAIHLNHVHKEFFPPAAQNRSFKETFLDLFAPPVRHAPIHALNDVSFSVPPGESIGIVGANGSGKSTLLKVISGIVQPTRGTVEIRGRVVSMIELGAGFHTDLTGEENVRLQGTIYGLASRQVDQRIQSIFDFAELGDFSAAPLRQYSSGMVARLGFAIAMHCDPDILLIDEVLSVGDQVFQERCLRAIADLQRRGVTIVFVTHHMEFAERVCQRLVWLKKGRVHRIGPSLDILQSYHQETLEELYTAPEGPLTSERLLVDRPGRLGTGEAVLDDVRLVDGEGNVRRLFAPGEPFTMEFHYRCLKPVEALDCSVTLTYHDGNNIGNWRAETAGRLQYPQRDNPSLQGCFRLHFANPTFAPGHYTHSPCISRPGGTGDHYDLHLRLHHFAIVAPDASLRNIAVEFRPRVERLTLSS